MRLFAAAALLLLSASPLPAEPGLASPTVGLAAGQIARITALNLGSRQSGESSSCQITAQFLDPKATVLKEQILEIAVGKSESLEFESDAAHSGKRVQLRAVLLFGHVGGAPPGPEARRMLACNIVPSLELYDKASGKTALILTDWKPLPTPDPRSIAALPSLLPSKIETMR